MEQPDSHPKDDILQNVEDISCAFHRNRMLLHPALGPTCASVFDPLLIIPCGCTFGAGNSPGIFMTLISRITPALLRSLILAFVFLENYTAVLSFRIRIQIQRLPENDPVGVLRGSFQQI
jgi:hypothetical protein